MARTEGRRFAVPLLLCCCEPRFPGLSVRSPIPAVGRVARSQFSPAAMAVLRLVNPCHPVLIADREPAVDLLHRGAQDRARIAPGTSSHITRPTAGTQNPR